MSGQFVQRRRRRRRSSVDVTPDTPTPALVLSKESRLRKIRSHAITKEDECSAVSEIKKAVGSDGRPKRCWYCNYC